VDGEQKWVLSPPSLLAVIYRISVTNRGGVESLRPSVCPRCWHCISEQNFEVLEKDKF
jgi:hypothetical protein